MATLFHQIKPGMERIIAEAEDQIEIKIAQQTERFIEAVYQRFNSLELLVLPRPARIINLTTPQKAIYSLPVDVDAMHYVRVPETKVPPA